MTEPRSTKVQAARKTNMKAVARPQNGRAESSSEQEIGGRSADQGIAAAAAELRHELAERYGAETALQRVWLDGAVASYYLQQVLSRGTTTIINLVEQEYVGQVSGAGWDGVRFLCDLQAGVLFDRMAKQLELQERSAKMLNRYLAGLQNQAASNAEHGSQRREQ